MNYFDAVSIEQDMAVGIQYAEMLGKTRQEAFADWVAKYGKHKIVEAITVLCNDLDEKKRRYASLLNIVKSLKSLEGT
jgi:hypothetical protein